MLSSIQHPINLDTADCHSYKWLNGRCRMDLVWITLIAWTAFTAAAILPGFLCDQVARGCNKAHA